MLVGIPIFSSMVPQNCQILLCLQRKNCAAKQQSVLTSDAGQQTSGPSDEVKACTTNGEAAPVDGELGTGSRSNTEDEEEGNNSGRLARFWASSETSKLSCVTVFFFRLLLFP